MRIVVAILGVLTLLGAVGAHVQTVGPPYSAERRGGGDAQLAPWNGAAYWASTVAHHLKLVFDENLSTTVPRACLACSGH